MKYQEWLNEWLINYVQPTAKSKTYIRYEEIVSQHIVPSLGNCEVDELSVLSLQHYVTELLSSGNLRNEKGLAPNSVNSIITVIQNSLRTASSIGVAGKYIGDKIKRPKTTEKKISCFSIAEQRRIEQAIMADKRDKMFGVLLCLYSGVRIGELLALEWTDVDLRAHTLSINRTCHDGRDSNGRYKRITGTPKTQTSRRVIPIPKQLVCILSERKKSGKSEFVISAENGEPIAVRSYQRSFELLLRKLGIEKRGFHSLRHTFATRALECGMDVRTLAEILGHKNPTVTLARYAHSMPEHKMAMMNRVGKLLS